MTVCNTCTLQLRTAKMRLDKNPELKEKVNAILEESGHPYKYQGTSKITHFLWVLDEHPEVLEGKISKSLDGFKVACYYGCHILRPQEVMNHGDGKHPDYMERLIRHLGGDAVWFDANRKCCGFHAQLAAEHDVLTATGQIVDSADRAGAQAIVTPCPLCQMQLDMYEPEGRSAVHSRAEIPVLHLQQLIGFALGMTQIEVGFDRHVSAQLKLKLGK